MSRNVESRFAVNPTNIDIQRSIFKRDSNVKLSFNVGDVIPFYIDEVLPGDTFKVRTSKLVRMQSLITPVMDNLYLDTYYFYVPNRLIWSHWKQFMGENTDSAWIPQNEYSIPQITAPSGGYEVGTIADYLGVPVGIEGLKMSALPFRAYALIMQEWFRDENLSDPLDVPVTDADVVGSNGDNYITDVAKGGMPFKAAKYHDYFTSALPSAQKGPAVTIGALGQLPVVTGLPNDLSSFPLNDQGYPRTLHWVHQDGSSPVTSSGTSRPYTQDSTGSVGYPTFVADPTPTLGLVPDNLMVDLAQATMTTINQLRLAFQIQKLYEKDARGGKFFQVA